MPEGSASEYTFPVGSVVGFQALKGEVKVRPSTNNPDLLGDVSTVFVRYAKGMRPANAPDVLSVNSVRVDKRIIFLTFKGFNDRTSVEHLEGAELFAMEKELLPLEEEEFWVKDLVGVEVFTTDGDRVGEVVRIIPGGTDLLEIKPKVADGDKTILVPFVTHLVPVVDMKSRRIEVVNMPGLLEPQ